MTEDLVLAVREYGTGSADEVVVALHGSHCTKEAWERVGTEGLPGPRWICPDLRGHGESPGQAPWTIAQCARDVVVTLDTLGIAGPVDVVGSSFSGAVAAELVRLIPVRSVVLIDPVLTTREECVALVARLRRTRVGPEFDTLGELIDPLLEEVPADARPHLRRELITRLEPTGAGRFRFRALESEVEAVLDDLCEAMPVSFASFAGRMLLLEAGQGAAVSEAGRNQLRAELGDRLTLARIEAGHVLLWYAYAQTVDEIARFLNGVHPNHGEHTESR
ncbi:MAG: alpha/beta fold hydrolase [Labedaea sp.]